MATKPKELARYFAKAARQHFHGFKIKICLTATQTTVLNVFNFENITKKEIFASILFSRKFSQIDLNDGKEPITFDEINIFEGLQTLGTLKTYTSLRDMLQNETIFSDNKRIARVCRR